MAYFQFHEFTLVPQNSYFCLAGERKKKFTVSTKCSGNCQYFRTSIRKRTNNNKKKALIAGVAENYYFWRYKTAK